MGGSKRHLHIYTRIYVYLYHSSQKELCLLLNFLPFLVIPAVLYLYVSCVAEIRKRNRATSIALESDALLYRRFVFLYSVHTVLCCNTVTVMLVPSLCRVGMGGAECADTLLSPPSK